MSMTESTKTKRWVVRIELDVKEGSHPRKFIPDCLNEALDLASGEDVIDYTYICID